MRKALDILRWYLQDQQGFLGLGGDKVTDVRTTLGERDTASTYAGREMGTNTAGAATGSDPWALGPGQGMYDAQNRYNDMYGNYGGAAGQYGGMAQDMYGRVAQGGLGIGNRYAGQIMDQYRQGMDPVYQQMGAERTMGAGQNAFLQGAGGGSRQTVAEAIAQRDVGQMQSADYGRQYGQAMQQGHQLGQMEQQRMLQAAGMAQQGQFAGMQGQMGANAAGAGMQGQITGALERQNADEYTRNLAAQNAKLGSFGRVTDTNTNTTEQGNLFGDILSLGGVASGFFPGGSGDQSGRFSSQGPGASAALQNQQSPLFQGGANLYNYGGGPNLGFGGQQWGGWGASGNNAFPMMYQYGGGQ